MTLIAMLIVVAWCCAVGQYLAACLMVTGFLVGFCEATLFGQREQVRRSRRPVLHVGERIAGQ